MTPGLLTCHQVYSHDTRYIRMLTGKLTRHQVYSHDTRSTHTTPGLLTWPCWCHTTAERRADPHQLSGRAARAEFWQSGPANDSPLVKDTTHTSLAREYQPTAMRTVHFLPLGQWQENSCSLSKHWQQHIEWILKCGDSIAISISTFKPVSFASMNK